jgi:hypothetical protein
MGRGGLLARESKVGRGAGWLGHSRKREEGEIVGQFWLEE